jgi:hypothetical protein
MKLLLPANIQVGAALLTGCISQQRELALEPVGPLDFQLARAGSNGTLVLF